MLLKVRAPALRPGDVLVLSITGPEVVESIERKGEMMSVQTFRPLPGPGFRKSFFCARVATFIIERRDS